MRTIDADAALKALRKCQTYLYDARDPELKIELSSAEAAIKELPTMQPEKAQLSKEGTTSDLISRTETVDHLRRMLDATIPITDYDEGYVDGVEFGVSTVSTMPTVQPQSTTGQLNDGAQSTAQSTDLIDRQAAIDECNKRGAEHIGYAIAHLPTVQPEPAIPLSWIEKYIEWLKGFDNEFANLEAAHISVMVKKWRDKQNERTD